MNLEDARESIGQRVQYNVPDADGGPEFGEITRVGTKLVFVRFDLQPATRDGVACYPEMLHLVPSAEFLAELQVELDQLAADDPEIADAADRVDAALRKMIDNIHVVHVYPRVTNNAPRIVCAKSCPGPAGEHVNEYRAPTVRPTPEQTAAYRALDTK